MRGSAGRMMVAIAALARAAIGQHPHAGPDRAVGVPESEALRIASRIDRGARSSGCGAMSLAALDAWATRRRRAAQTHPGKRGKRARG